LFSVILCLRAIAKIISLKRALIFGSSGVVPKQRNKHLQTTLIEAAKMAPRYSPTLALLYDREKQKGNANRATLAVARKLVAYLMAVDRGQCHFLVIDQETRTAA